MTGRSPRLPALIAAMLLLGAGAAARHPNSLSSSRWEIDGSTIRLVLRCQVVSVLEVVPALDADADQWIDEDELAAGREALRAYLAGHYRVRLDTGGDPGAGRPLPGRLVRLAREEDVAGFVPEQWIVTEWLFEDASPVRDLMLEMTLFFDTSPRHRDFAQIVWAGTEFPTQVLWMGAHRFHHAGVAPTIPAEPREDRAGAPAAGAAPDDARPSGRDRRRCSPRRA